MMIWILLLVLTSSVYGGLVMKMSLNFYQENSIFTISWDSQTQTDLSLANLICFSRPNSYKILYQMIRGIDVPESQYPQFAERVQLDKDALRVGRIRLHLSRVIAEDFGHYWCDLTANYDKNTRRWEFQATEHFVLNVTHVSHVETLSAIKGAKQLVGGLQQPGVLAIISPLTAVVGAAGVLGYIIVIVRQVILK